MIGLWLAGTLRRRLPQVLVAAAGVAVAVALLAALGAFVAAARGTMTAQVERNVGLDWQVAVTAGRPEAVRRTTLAQPGTRAAVVTGFASTPGLEATTQDGTATTGTGTVVGLPDGYAATFPHQLRLLVGTMRPGTVLLAQQTAANLHAGPGSTIVVRRGGARSYRVVVGGVVELPNADVLFHTVGQPPTAQPTAPPDNVVLLPMRTFRSAYDQLAGTRPGAVRWQVHAARDAPLPADPVAAYTVSTAQARHLEVVLAGSGVVGDDLGDALAAAREDAAYAQVLFLFLGVPGVAVAVLLTVAVQAAAADRRRRDRALLRLRGAPPRTLVALAVGESLLSGVAAVVLGLVAATGLGLVGFGSVTYGAPAAAATSWFVVAAGTGLVVQLVTDAVIGSSRRREGPASGPATPARPARTPVPVLVGATALLAVGGLLSRASSDTGYQLVLAPEGSPAISVDWWAFAGPALLWVGAAVLLASLTRLLLVRGRGLLGVALRPLTGSLDTTAAAVLARRSPVVARAVVTLALALAFAATTAVFTTTYADQAQVDARLTNGADVTVTEPPSAGIGPDAAREIAKVHGVQAVEPLQHRFAYVGSDLQDLYGIRPTTITRATSLQDSWFQGGTVSSDLGALASRRDGVLVSAETVNDYQLHRGDVVRLRLLDARTHRYRAVPFHYVGIAAEFPTAPRDSFLVTNADYVAAQTGDEAVGAFLVRTGSSAAPEVAGRLRSQLGAGSQVTDLHHVSKVIGSTLTAVDVAGLARIELAAALALTTGAAGIVVLLGLLERRRTAAVVALLGADRGSVRGLVASEVLTVLAAGAVAAVLVTLLVAPVLVGVLHGVFDPPPQRPSIPTGYLVLLAAVTAVAGALATVAAAAGTRVNPTTLLRVDAS